MPITARRPVEGDREGGGNPAGEFWREAGGNRAGCESLDCTGRRGIMRDIKFLVLFKQTMKNQN